MNFGKTFVVGVAKIKLWMSLVCLYDRPVSCE